MNYEETNLQRTLKRLITRLDPDCKKSENDQSSDDERKGTEEETLEVIRETVSSILARYELVCENDDDSEALRMEFGKLPFEEKDERIEVASQLIFRNAIERKRFGFIPDVVLGWENELLVTRQKFVKKFIQHCDAEVQRLKLDYLENTPSPERTAIRARVFTTIDCFYKLDILSTKAVLHYIDLLLEIGSDEVTSLLCVLLKRIGVGLDSITKKAELYMNGMLKLGKKLDWFDNFKTLDPAFFVLEKLSKTQRGSLPDQVQLQEDLKEVCALRQSGWKRSNRRQQDKMQIDDTKHQEEEQDKLETSVRADDNEDNSSGSEDDDEPGTNEVTRTDSDLADYFKEFTIGSPISPELIRLKKAELLAREDYFNFWLRDYSVTAETLDVIVGSLYEYVREPTGSGDISDFEETIPSLCMMTLQEATVPLVDAFLNMQVGNLQLTKSNVMWVEKLVQYFLKSKIVSEEHCSGLSHLCTLLRIDWCLREGTATEATVRCLDVPDFGNLKPKGSSIVCIARWMLNQSIFERKAESVQYLKQARDLDPENWVWNYNLCNRLRFHRRQDFSTGGSMPDEVELQAIINAVLHAPTTAYAMCISGLCQALAEILRFTSFKRVIDKPIDIGTRVFTSSVDIKDYIVEQVGKVLEGESVICFAEYIRYGEILSSILPNEYRNYDLAELCYMNCLGIMPTNSKANHRMGLLQLTGKHDVQMALKYFRIAVAVQPNNYPAWMDLLQTLLGTVVPENELKIGNTFSQAMKLDVSKESMRSSLHYLHGCYYWIIKNKDAAIKEWMLSTADSGSSFERLPSMRRRHLWPREIDISLHEVFDEIQFQSAAKTVEDKDALLALASVVENAAAGSGNRNHNSRYQQQGYQTQGYYPRIRTTSASDEYGTNTDRRGSEAGPRTKPVSIADNDNSWRTSSVDTDKFDSSPSPSYGSQPRGGQPYTGRSPSNQNQYYGNSPRNTYGNRPWDNGNAGKPGNPRQNRPPSPESWR